jgi:hypothetical protein
MVTNAQIAQAKEACEKAMASYEAYVQAVYTAGTEPIDWGKMDRLATEFLEAERALNAAKRMQLEDEAFNVTQ